MPVPQPGSAGGAGELQTPIDEELLREIEDQTGKKKNGCKKYFIY